MEIIITSVVSFATTNNDDIFILILFFGNRNYKSRDIVIGQYLGVIALIAISFLGYLIGLIMSKDYIGVLGIFPIFLGIKSLIGLFKKKKDVDIESNQAGDLTKGSSIITVAAVTFANGGDNIGIYIPLFATLSMSDKWIMTSIFLVMIGLWCLAVKYLASHPSIAWMIDRYGHVIMPIVLILLGIYIMYESVIQ